MEEQNNTVGTEEIEDKKVTEETEDKNITDEQIDNEKVSFLERVKVIFGKIGSSIGKFFGKIASGIGKLFKKKESSEEIPEIYLPETTEDLVWVLSKLPSEVLSDEDRQKIMAVMTFSSKRARDIMIPRDDIVFVHENDFMGPLTLDKLYQSGLSHFPVLNATGGIAGILDTSKLNKLEVKETDRASSYLSPEVYYVRENYTLPMVLNTFSRTGAHFLIVIDSDEKTVGLIYLKSLISVIAGDLPDDDFSQDDNSFAVAKRG